MTVRALFEMIGRVAVVTGSGQGIGRFDSESGTTTGKQDQGTAKHQVFSMNGHPVWLQLPVRQHR